MAQVTQSIDEDYFSRRESLAKEIVTLLEQAGIAKEVEQCESLFEPDYFRDQELAPFGTELRRRQEKERDASDWVMHRNGLRHIYFKVLDRDLKLQLIKKEREFKELRLTSWLADLRGAQKRLHEVEAKSSSGLGVAISAAAIVLIGANIGNLVGAIAAAVFAIILGIYSFKEQQIRKEREIASAKADVQMYEDSLEEEESCQEVFSYNEQLWGEPDQQT
jgi:hypothetical protein